MVAPFLGMVGFGTVKFWDDGFEQLMEESPNSQLRMPFLTYMSVGFWGAHFLDPYKLRSVFPLLQLGGWVQNITQMLPVGNTYLHFPLDVKHVSPNVGN